MKTTINKSVLFVGQCYYNTWYLSRELRKVGWKAEVISMDESPSNQHHYHGSDFYLTKSTNEEKFKSFHFFFWSIFSYEIFHFSNTNCIQFIDFYDLTKKRDEYSIKGMFYKISKKIFNAFIGTKISRIYFLKKLIGIKNIYRLLNYFAPFLPERWDILLLKRFGKKIVYTNNGCHDGVLQSSFAKWSTPTNEPVCDICPWKNQPSVCSDTKMKKWGEFRNSVADYQCLLGGNRADYNLDKRIHEVPYAYCLDRNFWNPDLLIPSNYLLPVPKETIKILHAVGNYVTRSHSGNKSIKSTHIYLPLIDRLKKEGYNVELIFFTDISNSTLRYYQLQADIVVDMLSVGFFGANLREAMMLGKPCVCNLRPEWLGQMKTEIPDYVNELPIVNANETDIYEVLVDLIKSAEKRKSIGEKSRAFAVKWHSSEVAAKKFDEIYTDLLYK